MWLRWITPMMMIGMGTAGASAGSTALSLLHGLSAGEWELQMRDSGSVQRLCMVDRRQLIQLRHRNLQCDHLVVSDRSSDLVVQYTCPGRGFGRTGIRRESAELVQLEYQGVANGLPFDFTAEGRRVGSCRN